MTHDLCYDIARRITEAREEQTGITQERLGCYLSSFWNIQPRGAEDYVYRVEQGTIIIRLARVYEEQRNGHHMLQWHEQRIADMFNALGIRPEDRKHIMQGIEQIQPHWQYRPSTIPLYVPPEQVTLPPRYARLVKNLQELGARYPERLERIEQDILDAVTELSWT
ncbi:hypothetical protein GF342_04260 [Candidatus Woesearchaeota archaeon]|nr:hypothetical protein [Candidatus Woesearchaeota archaeon]